MPEPQFQLSDYGWELLLAAISGRDGAVEEVCAAHEAKIAKRIWAAQAQGRLAAETDTIH